MATTDEELPTGAARAHARKAAEKAIGDWVRATFADVGAFATCAGVAGPDRLVVFAAVGDDDGDFDVQRAELTTVTVAGPQRAVVLTRTFGDPRLWTEAVTLWADLRDAEATSVGAEVPFSLVVAADDGIVVGYDELYCDTHGPNPTWLAEVDLDGTGDDDPFDALLSGPDTGWDDLLARLDQLFTRYQLTPPGEPAGVSCDDED